MSIIKTKVCFDDYFETLHNDDLKIKNIKSAFLYDAYADPNIFWNGWACPYFEKETFERFVEWQEKNSDDSDLLDQIKSVEPENINGLILYDVSLGLCWNIYNE